VNQYIWQWIIFINKKCNYALCVYLINFNTTKAWIITFNTHYGWIIYSVALLKRSHDRVFLSLCQALWLRRLSYLVEGLRTTPIADSSFEAFCIPVQNISFTNAYHPRCRVFSWWKSVFNRTVIIKSVDFVWFMNISGELLVDQHSPSSSMLYEVCRVQSGSLLKSKCIICIKRYRWDIVPFQV